MLHAVALEVYGVLVFEDRRGLVRHLPSHLIVLFAFVSEIKGLLVLPWISRNIEPKALYWYPALGYVPASFTNL